MQTVVDLFVLAWINIMLSGDNALVIAMATRRLPAGQRRRAAVFGAAAAVALRILLTILAARWLTKPYIQAAAGVALLWIAVRLILPGPETLPPADEQPESQPPQWWEAVRTIVLADVTMSIDNVLAVAAAAQGNLLLLIAGLALSIPLIVWGSDLIRLLLNRMEWLVYPGAGLLGWMAGGLVAEDPGLGIADQWPGGAWWTAGLAACAVVGVGLWKRWPKD